MRPPCALQKTMSRIMVSAASVSAGASGRPDARTSSRNSCMASSSSTRSVRQKALEQSQHTVTTWTELSIRNWSPVFTASPPLLVEMAYCEYCVRRYCPTTLAAPDARGVSMSATRRSCFPIGRVFDCEVKRPSASFLYSCCARTVDRLTATLGGMHSFSIASPMMAHATGLLP